MVQFGDIKLPSKIFQRRENKDKVFVACRIEEHEQARLEEIKRTAARHPISSRVVNCDTAIIHKVTRDSVEFAVRKKDLLR